MNRRTYLRTSATLFGASTLGFWPAFSINPEEKRFKIGACDWSLKQRGKLEAFEVGKSLGLDGLQVSCRVKAEENLLEERANRKAWLKKARYENMTIGSLALGLLNQHPYKSDPRAEDWVLDSIQVAKKMKVKVILLAFFGKGNIKEDLKGRKAVIERLKKVAPKAEKAGVILGIESLLSAKEHVEIMDAVGSKNVQVYYDVANSNRMGYDIYEEIKWLGKERICEFHAKENGYLLGQGLIDFKKLRRVIDEIEYSGWIQIEGAMPKGAEMMESYVENHRVMRAVFGN